MEPDERFPRPREPYFVRLWHRAAAMAPLLLLAGVLLAWIMATDALSLGGARREAGLTGATPRAMTSDTPPAALTALSATPTSSTEAAAQEAMTPSAAAEQASPTGESAPPARPAGQATPAAPPNEPPGPAVETETALAPETTTPPTAGPDSTATPGPTEASLTTATPLTMSAATPAPPPQTGWTAYGGEWSWREPGVLVATTDQGDALWLFDSPYGDFTFSAEVQAMDREASLAFRMPNEDNGFLLVLIPQGATANEPGLYLIKRVSGEDRVVATAPTSDLPWVDDWATLAVEATGGRLSLYLNGNLVMEYEDSGPPAFGYGRLGFHIAGDEEEPANATFRNIRLPVAAPS